MSRIGKNPVAIPDGVTIDINGQDVKVKGSKGELSLVVHDEVAVTKTDDGIKFAPKTKSRLAKTLYPTTRTLLNNMVTGVTQGFKKELQINGVGLRANMQGNTLVMQLGYSHEVRYDIPQGVQVTVTDQTQIAVEGIDNQAVGQVAAKIRDFKRPEPYKGKGIKYKDEYIFRKEGKKK